MGSLQFPTENKLKGFVFMNVFMPPVFIEHLLYSKYCAAAEDDREVN